MGRIRNQIHEMVVHVRTMTESERRAFKIFIGEGKSNNSIHLLLRAMERTDPEKPPVGIIKRLVVMPDGNDYRTFERFKKKLFEFEISSKRLGYFKSEDHYTYLSVYLRKEVIASQLILERNAFQTSIDILLETNRKSVEFEHMRPAYESARDLAKYYGYMGQVKHRKFWIHKRNKYDGLNRLQQTLLERFEQYFGKPYCCYQHIDGRDKQEVESLLREAGKCKLKVAEWMIRFIKTVHLRVNIEPKETVRKIYGLRKIILRNPGIYPVLFTVAYQVLLLEMLFQMNWSTTLTKGAFNVYRASKLLVYQSIPVYRFYACYLIRKRHTEHYLAFIISQVNRIDIYHRFTEFMGLMKRIEMLSHIIDENYGDALQVLNRPAGEYRIDCEHVNFQLKVLEIIALYRLKKDLTAIDRVIAMKKYVQRSEVLRNNDYCLLLMEIFNELNKNTTDYLKFESTPDQSLYELKELIIEEVISAFPDRKIEIVRKDKVLPLYPSSAPEISKVAEDSGIFGK